MAWTCTYGNNSSVTNLVDDGHFYTTSPPLSGSLSTDDNSLVTTATAAAGSLSITFASVAASPSGGMAMVLTDTSSPTTGGGDFFRWYEDPWPASPLTLSSITAPAAQSSMPTAVLQSRVDAKLPLVVGDGGRDLSANVTVTKLTFTPVAPASLDYLALASAATRSGKTTLASISFSIAGSLVLAPSRDPRDTSRILAMTASPGAKLTVFGFEPAILPNLGADNVAELIAQAVESNFNSIIVDQVLDGLRKSGQTLAPDSVISAQRVVITSAGLTLGLVLANLHGAVQRALPIAIRVAVSPDPVGRAGIATQYTVAVTDDKGNAIDGANVQLENYSGDHQPKFIGGSTDKDGMWTSPPVALHSFVIAHTGRTIAPTVTVKPTAATPPFAEVTVSLDPSPF